jgi:signal transduction histidine kinase
VTIRYEPADVVIEVDDDGRGPATTDGRTGYGLAGMAERSAAVGGNLEAGRRPGGGFRVTARLPAARSSS